MGYVVLHVQVKNLCYNQLMKKNTKNNNCKISNVVAGIASIVFILLGCIHTYIRIVSEDPSHNTSDSILQQKDYSENLDNINKNIISSTYVLTSVSNELAQYVCFGLGAIFLLYILKNKNL